MSLPGGVSPRRPDVDEMARLAGDPDGATPIDIHSDAGKGKDEFKGHKADKLLKR